MKAETTIIANGQPRSVPNPCSVADFLVMCGFKATQVVVEHNGVVLDRKALGAAKLEDGDRLEVILPVAGG